jgi:polygalacturonase
MIKQNNKVFDNVFRGDNLIIDSENPYCSPIDVLPISNIKIIGKNGAKIVGCDVNRKDYHPVLKETQDMVGDFWGWRTLQISLSRCSGFEVAGIEFLQTRSWALSFDFCNNGYVHDLNIISNVKNGDGVNFRAGCHNCKVENITGYTSDDTVACNVTSRSCRSYPYKNYLYSNIPALKSFSGGERDYDVHDISIKGIYTGGNHHGVICLAAGGARVYNIDICDIIEDTKGKREATVKIYTGYGDNYCDNDLNNITVTNVQSNIADFAVLCNTKVDNVVLKNIVQNNPNKTKISLVNKSGIVVE